VQPAVLLSGELCRQAEGVIGVFSAVGGAEDRGEHDDLSRWLYLMSFSLAERSATGNEAQTPLSVEVVCLTLKQVKVKSPRGSI
jgi:hypothetical protein